MTFTNYARRLKQDNIVVVDNFISAATCAELLAALSKCVWMPSQSAVYGKTGIQENHEPSRQSSTVAAGAWPTPIASRLAEIQRSIKKHFGIYTNRLEEWQATRYVKGEFFDFHLDCGCWKNHPAGERKRSILIYLDHPARGGSTFFRALNLKIEPLPGRLVVWNNLLPDGNCNHAMIHRGLPVLQGLKTILIVWERQRKYLKE